jgi:superfamily II DNA helicase RecQ
MFETEYSLKAIAVNGENGGCTDELTEMICSGKWQIVIISPEMMLSKKFVTGVLRNPEFTHRLVAIVIDEAHVVSHWGADFRKQYGRLGILRALLPKSTPMVAMSATLPPHIRKGVLQTLQFGKDYVNINLGNDRPNVSIVVRAIQSPMNTYNDLDFVIPSGVAEASQIPKTFIYADNLGSGPEIEHYLYKRCSPNLQELGVIRPYSAAYSPEYRKEVMSLFKAGVIRILICTDAAGMVRSILDHDIRQ